MESAQLSRWREAVEGIDLVSEDSREQLNQLYSVMVTQLRQRFQSATFTAAARSLDQKRAEESADPDTETERLWELASHHPGAVTNQPVWKLLLLGGKGLIGKKESIDEEQLFPFAQVEGFWQEVQRRYKDDYYNKLLLSYTALLPLDKHPFRKNPLIRALYEAGDVVSATDLKNLEWQTDALDSYSNGTLLPVKDSLASLEDPEFPLPGALNSPAVDDLMRALAPVFWEGDELFNLVFNRGWGSEGVFLDASPVADQLVALSKTKLVERGVRVHTESLLPAEVYERLSKHRNSGPKSEVAQCVHTPSEILEELSQSSSKEIVYPLARNPMTPFPVLRQLMDWGGWGAKTVQRHVQDNPAYVGGEAWQLMEMGRLQLQIDQRKKDVLLACLNLLASEPDPMDGLRLLLNATLWASWRLEPSTLRLQMIQKGWASEELLQAAAWSWHWLERLAVARSPHAPATALTKLQGDGLPFIRHAALQPRRSAYDAAAATAPGGWKQQLVDLASSDPINCVRHPRFQEWLEEEPVLVTELLQEQHRKILAADDLPVCYFEWRLSQGTEGDQLRLLLHPQVPQAALDLLVGHETGTDQLVSMLPESRQGIQVDLVASTAASHRNQTNPELLRCSLLALQKPHWDDLTPHEIAFFVMGFYNPADVSLLNTPALLKLILHPHGSSLLRRHIGQELDNRGDTLTDFLGGYAMGNAIGTYARLQGKEHALNQLKIGGQLLGLEEISDGLRAQFIPVVADLAAEVFILKDLAQWLEELFTVWPAVLSKKDTRKLLSSARVKQRLVAICFGALDEVQMEQLASDSRDEARFALALLRSCPGTVLEKLTKDRNPLVRKAAFQNMGCPISLLVAAAEKNELVTSLLRNPETPEASGQRLLSNYTVSSYLSHTTPKIRIEAAQIFCWTPLLMEMVVARLDADLLRSFSYDLKRDDPPLRDRPYSSDLLTWMAKGQLQIDPDRDLTSLRELAAFHPKTPLPVLEVLAQDHSDAVLRAVASNPSCPKELHHVLRDRGVAREWVQPSVIASPSYPKEWLAEWAADTDPDHRAMVTRHPYCPKELLVQLLGDTKKTSEHGPFPRCTVAEVAANSPVLTTLWDPADFQAAALALLRSTKPSRGRRLALRSPHCPPELLRRCTTSLDWRERHDVASHPATPSRLLKALQQDSNQHVRQAVSARIEPPSTVAS
jgi:hypothetical protein